MLVPRQHIGQEKRSESANLEEVMCGSTLLRINLESEIKEILEDGGQVMVILDLWSPIGCDQVQCSEW